MRRLAFCVVTLCATSCCQAATYFVSSTSGNDLNSGLGELNPWKTVDKVNLAMSSGLILPGDRVLLKRGEVFMGTLQPRSGLLGLPVTVGAYGLALSGPEEPTLAGIEIHDRSNVVVSGLRVDKGFTGEAISIENSSDVRVEEVRTLCGDFGIHLSRGDLARITIRNSIAESAKANGIFVGGYIGLAGLTIEDSSINASGNVGLAIDQGTTQGLQVTLRKLNVYGNARGGIVCRGVSALRVLDSTVSNNQGAGVSIFNATWDVSIDGLLAEFNTEAGLMFAQDSNRINDTISDVRVVASKLNGNGQDGLALRGRGNKTTITRTEASRNSGDGFNIKNNWQEVNFERCSATENGVRGLVSGGGDGFSFHNTSSGVISRCYAKDNSKSAAGHIDASSVDMINNLFLHSSQGSWPLIHGSGTGTFNIWHNTLVTGAATGTGIRLQNGARADVRNNIVVGGSIGITKSQMAAFAEDNDILWGMATPFQYFKGGPRSLVANPMFLNPGAGDYRPSPLSPAVDYATWVGALYDYSGTRRKSLLPTPIGLGLVPYADVGAFEQYEYVP